MTVQRSCRLSKCRQYITITTPRKRGKKVVPNVSTYRISDLDPDPRVAYPAFALTKGTLDGDVFTPSGEEWHVSVQPHGAECSCPHRTFHPNDPDCKHVLALRAAGFLNTKGIA